MFLPAEIIGVTSADKTKEYEEGRDYEVRGDELYLTPDTRIFAFQESELIFDEAQPNGSTYPTEDGKWSLLQGGHFFHDRQIAVTYKKKPGGEPFEVEFCGKQIPMTMQKLKDKEHVGIVLYGDSISEGSNSSGITLTTPFLPTWGKLVAEKLARHYETGVKLWNNAKGGMDSRWGIEHAKELVADYNPNLAIIAFGMNDRDEPEQFAKNIKKIRDIILQHSAGTEFIICATTIARPGLNVGNYYRHQAEYRDAIQVLKKKGTAIADFYSMQMYMMRRKRFIDLTGNNVNHPNDFMVRCHGQVICDMLIQK